MSLGSYPDFQFFPRVGVFEGFFWPPRSFVIYLPYSLHSFSCLLSLRYFMITQPLGSNVSLGPYPSCLVNYIVNIFTPNKVWSMVVRTHADRIQFAPCILLCLVLFGRNMPSIVQNYYFSNGLPDNFTKRRQNGAKLGKRDKFVTHLR